MTFRQDWSRIEVTPWQSERIIVIDKCCPVGMLLSEEEGRMIHRWLATAVTELEAHFRFANRHDAAARRKND